MNFDDLIERYKSLASRTKFILLATLAAIYPLFYLWENWSNLDDQLRTSQLQRDQAEISFKKAREQKDKLPKLEEQLEYTEAELTKASKKLPNQFQMEQILEKVSMLAEDSGVNLEVFQPGEPIISGTIFRYLQLPINIQLMGTYPRIVTFLDKVVHLEMIVHFHDMDLNVTINKKNPLIADKIESDTKVKKPSDISPANLASELKRATLEKSAANRKELRVATTAKMMIFRSLTEEESKKMDEETTKVNQGQKPPPK